ncbi:hypothetical protein [Fimbriimonas ginsengisoli]|uniref:Uncharacterized protein n=1 Tax=Fimbriimonas ginsengisoli Gsoil 348 TaxID=661478 RepID=A0A068NKW2_FIMGI|nr:hypothetical protein [Fimbriimonas ginsengisoli]AIE84233.1 hypothetical protein OP10G_0865 [Fimbriimonas ginsengisoli Gsoil 348]
MTGPLDPGLWVVIAMVAIVHFTWIGVRRFGSPFRLGYLAIGLLTTLIGLLMCGAGLFSSSPPAHPSPLIFIVPLLSGLTWAACARTPGMAIGAVAIAFFAGHCLNLVVTSLATPTYGVSQAEFRSISESVAAIDHPIPRGFLSPEEIPGQATLTYSEPATAWYSPLTGITSSQIHRYRIWTPGGTPAEAAKRLRLVPDDAPEPNS